MTDNASDLANLTHDYYQDDPQLGDIVFLRSNFEDATIRGVVTGVRRFHPHRGLDAENNYEVVIYQRLKIRVAGIKQWLLLEDTNNGWEVTDTLRGPQFNKLEPRVVIESFVDDINNERTDDEL